MPPSSKVGQEIKFQQRWEFRRRDNDLDSSSDESKSSLSGEPVFKKHKLVSTLSSTENDETSDTPKFQQKGKDDPGTGGHLKSRKAKKMGSKRDNLVNRKVEEDSSKKITRKKRKSSTYDPASSNDTKSFMESLLEELKFTRENLSVWMQEEMHKLAEFDATLQTRREGSDGCRIVPVQQQRNFEPSMNLMTEDTIQWPKREGSYGQEIVQVQHQNNFESGMKLMKDYTTLQPPRREASSAEEINQVQHHKNFESGMRLMKDDTNRQPSRREGSSAEAVIQMQNQYNFEPGIRLMKDGTNQQPSRKGGSFAEEISQTQHQYNFEASMKLIKDDKTQLPKRKGGNHGQEIIQVQNQNNFESSMHLMKDDATEQPTRREDGNGQGIIQMHHRNNLESGMRLVKDGTTIHPTRKESSYGQEIIRGQHQHNFESGTDMTRDDTRRPRREGSFGQEIVEVQHQNKFGSSVKAQKCNGGSLGRPAKGQQTTDSNNCFQVFEDQVQDGQDVGLLMSIEKDKVERLGFSVKPKFSFDSSGQVVSSMYLTLPTVLPEPHAKNHRIDSSSCNYIQPGVSWMGKVVTIERENPFVDPSTLHGCSSGLQQEEQLRSITQVCPRSVGCLDQNSDPMSSFGTGFPVPLHPGVVGSLRTPSQVSVGNLPREHNPIFGLSMSGGAIKFSEGSSLSAHYIPNNLHNHLSHKVDGRLEAFRTPGLKEGQS